MTKFIDLINSLTAVIIRYHDLKTSQQDNIVTVTNPELYPEEAYKFSHGILNSIAPPLLQERLDAFIAKSNSVDATRTSLLNYIRDTIVFFKPMYNFQAPYSAETSAQYETNVTRMLINFKNLLMTSTGTLCSVKNPSLSEVEISTDVSGLINTPHMFTYSQTMSNSGTLLQELLRTVHMSRFSSNEYISQVAKELCSDHLKHIHIGRLEQEIAQQNATISALTEAKQLQLIQFNTHTQEMTGIIEQLEATIASLRPHQQQSALRLNSVFSYSMRATLSNPMSFGADRGPQVNQALSRHILNPALASLPEESDNAQNSETLHESPLANVTGGELEGSLTF